MSVKPGEFGLVARSLKWICVTHDDFDLQFNSIQFTLLSVQESGLGLR